jgi:hypothetical protein
MLGLLVDAVADQALNPANRIGDWADGPAELDGAPILARDRITASVLLTLEQPRKDFAAQDIAQVELEAQQLRCLLETQVLDQVTVGLRHW